MREWERDEDEDEDEGMGEGMSEVILKHTHTLNLRPINRSNDAPDRKLQSGSKGIVAMIVSGNSHHSPSAIVWQHIV